MGNKLKLIIMNFLQFAVWGAYLTSMGGYLQTVDMASNIGVFYAVQGIVSIFMPAIMGIIADRWIPAPKLLGICHFVAAAAILATGYYGLMAGDAVQFTVIFPIYTLAVAFYMPTIALSYSTAYSILDDAGLDTVKTFPPIRTFGTVGFICSMIFVDAVGFQHSPNQFLVSGVIGLALAVFAMFLPASSIVKSTAKKTLVESLGLKAFALFKRRQMAVFFIFSMFLGVALQLTNAFANPFLSSFKEIPEYANSFGANHANILISISQIAETLFILLIPFCLKRWGIKTVMILAMIAWVLRFALFGLGNPGTGVWMFILSMVVYGIAFDFFNISGSLFVNSSVDKSIRSSAQGLFMLMTNGIGAAIGTLAAQAVVNYFVYDAAVPNWSAAWYVFAGYALVVTVLFAILFKYKHEPQERLVNVKH